MNDKHIYLKRVARWLPRHSREDIIIDLDAAIEEFLADSDASASYEAIEQAFGHPAIAAARFSDGKPVINAGLAGAYRKIVAIVCPIVFFAQIARAYVESAGRSPDTQSIVAASLAAFSTLFFAIGVITAIFVFLDGGWRTICRMLGLSRSTGGQPKQ